METKGINAPSRYFPKSLSEIRQRKFREKED